MSESPNTGCVWPEQEVVDAWLKNNGILTTHEKSMALKSAVSEPRIRLQHEIERLHKQMEGVANELMLTQRQRDAAEDRFVKQRQECVEQEDEIARLTQEIDTRKKMFACLQEEYDAAKPYIRTQECDEGFNDGRHGDGLMRTLGAGFVSGALFMVVMWAIFT